MPYLVYCVMTAPAVRAARLPGLAGGEVAFVGACGLDAAVSEMARPADRPSPSALLAYGNVVEELHRRQTVIPMRYGCFVADIPALRGLLAEKQGLYASLLRELGGQVEMGLRILCPQPAPTGEPPSPTPGDGARYLLLRRAHYRLQEETLERHRSILDRYLQALSGLYGKQRTETVAQGGSVLLSLYLLVPQELVGRFREAVGSVVAGEGCRALVSGPWPPYSFTVPEPVPVLGTEQQPGGRR